VGLGEGHVEDHQEIAPRRAGDLGAGRERLQIDGIEADHRALAPPFVDGEVGGGEAAHRLAVGDHLDGDLDGGDAGGVGEGLAVQRRGRAKPGGEECHRGQVKTPARSHRISQLSPPPRIPQTSRLQIRHLSAE
jgi:hypothetical protein